MRHRKKLNHLSRKKGHRQAMLSNMAASLIIHKRIKTTTAKAKALKIYIEPLITKAKEDTTQSRREVFSYLQDKDATSELFRDVAEKIGDRPGGYTRIIKLGNRLGDSADMCIIELVDYNEVMLAEKAATTKSTRRRRGGKKKPAGEAAQAPEGSLPEKAEPTSGDAEESGDKPAAGSSSESEPVESKTVDEAPETGETESDVPEEGMPVAEDPGNEDAQDEQADKVKNDTPEVKTSEASGEEKTMEKDEKDQNSDASEEKEKKKKE